MCKFTCYLGVVVDLWCTPRLFGSLIASLKVEAVNQHQRHFFFEDNNTTSSSGNFFTFFSRTYEITSIVAARILHEPSHRILQSTNLLKRLSNMPPRAPKTAPKDFHLFPKLPIEIRLSIWEFAFPRDTRFIDLTWYPATRDFRSHQKVPRILHITQETRALGLKTYQLGCASSPEFARVYFNFAPYGDVLFLNWASLGAEPGRIARKISDLDLDKVRNLMVREDQLLLHADQNMRELLRFKNLECVSVLCDDENPESGDAWGAEEMHEYSEQIDEEGEERWPEMVCLRDPQEELDGPCSRHW